MVDSLASCFCLVFWFSILAVAGSSFVAADLWYHCAELIPKGSVLCGS